MTLRFTRMHGAGNAIVVVDARQQAFDLGRASIAGLGDAQRGIGFDQWMLIEQQPYGLGYRVFNRDGSDAAQCGNGARCVVAWLHQRTGWTLPNQLLSPSGPVRADVLPDGRYEVGLGCARAISAREHFYSAAGVIMGRRVDMGNPHFVIECDEPADADVSALGAWLNQHAAFPDGVNVAWVSRRGPVRSMRVYERGVGETLACGSGACAVAACMFDGMADAGLARVLELALPGGRLRVRAAPDGELLLAGPVCFVYDAELAPE